MGYCCAERVYDVALLNPSGAELFRTTATAKLEDHVVVMRAGVDLAGVPPGLYFLGVRRSALEWMRVSIHRERLLLRAGAAKC